MVNCEPNLICEDCGRPSKVPSNNDKSSSKDRLDAEKRKAAYSRPQGCPPPDIFALPPSVFDLEHTSFTRAWPLWLYTLRSYQTTSFIDLYNVSTSSAPLASHVGVRTRGAMSCSRPWSQQRPPKDLPEPTSSDQDLGKRSSGNLSDVSIASSSGRARSRRSHASTTSTVRKHRRVLDEPSSAHPSTPIEPSKKMSQPIGVHNDNRWNSNRLRPRDLHQAATSSSSSSRRQPQAFNNNKSTTSINSFMNTSPKKKIAKPRAGPSETQPIGVHDDGRQDFNRRQHQELHQPDTTTSQSRVSINNKPTPSARKIARPRARLSRTPRSAPQAFSSTEQRRYNLATLRSRILSQVQ